MPLYEYQCRRCEEHFEVLQKVGEDGEELVCPRCGADRPGKQLSTFSSRVTSTPSSAACACSGGAFT